MDDPYRDVVIVVAGVTIILGLMEYFFPILHLFR
jgi:hypothetical protein